MNRATLTQSFMLVVCLTVTLSSSQAQTSSNGEYSSNRDPLNVKPPSKHREANSSEQLQRATAISIINSLVNESEHYEDQTLRVRTVARAADALWNVDESLARSLFLQAWTLATKLDRGSEQTFEAAKTSALKSRAGNVTMILPPTSIRSEVISLAARRDPALANIFISKLDEAKKQENGSTDQVEASAEYPDPTEPSLAIAKRLEVALQLLNAGEIKEAKTFADPALAFATSPGIIFLCNLRQKDSDGADRFYSRLLARAASDRDAEATTVSLLSSYVLTPNYLVTATRHGRVSNQFGEVTQTLNPSPELRSRFFGVAATILLRPIPLNDQDNTVAGRSGTYFTIARLLPMFEAYAPGYVPALKNQLDVLGVDAPETFRNGQDAMLRLGLESNHPQGDSITEILAQLTNATTSADRDVLYVKAIREGATIGDPRIRQFASKIEDESLRDRARSFADLAIIRKTISKKDLDVALSIARDGYLVSLHRVWALAQIGHLMGKANAPAAMQLLDDASAEAYRIPVGDPNRVYALSCVASGFLAVDRLRSWTVASDVVKAANAVPGFTGGDAKLSARLRVRNVISMISEDEPSFSVVNLFESLAKDDLQLALSTANSLSGENARASASLAVARSILEKPKSSVLTK